VGDLGVSIWLVSHAKSAILEIIRFYGIERHMNAVLAIGDRRILKDGAIIEIVIWKVPVPVSPGEHDWKYQLFYGRTG
jgi:hypothetical protein